MSLQTQTPSPPQVSPQTQIQKIKIIEEKKCIKRKRECHLLLLEECYIEVCHTWFSIEVIEFKGGPIGLVIKYRGKTMYLPPIVSEEKIVLPLKYSIYFEPTVFPEIKFRRWG